MAYKCHLCSRCNGMGCIGQMPGMGGPEKSINFINNCRGWDNISLTDVQLEEAENLSNKTAGIAPMTGAVENAGFEDEISFYDEILSLAYNEGFHLTIGDGTPDQKLLNGISAVKKLQAQDSSVKASVFIKPYPDDKFYERLEWALPVADGAGLDIDAYNIITMRNLVHLEKKTPSQLLELKKYLNAKGIPLIIKGVFTNEDIAMVKEVKPDVIYISNHGGRVETEHGSTASFIQSHGKELKPYCSELWIDGGIRTKQDVMKAITLGASQVLMGRPFITALCRQHITGQKGSVFYHYDRKAD